MDKETRMNILSVDLAIQRELSYRKKVAKARVNQDADFMKKLLPLQDKDVSLQQLRDKLAEFAKVRGWEQYHSPRNLLLALVGEVGELSEIFQWKGEVERGLPNWSCADKEHLEEELSDVLLYLIQLAEVCKLDLGQAAL